MGVFIARYCNAFYMTWYVIIASLSNITILLLFILMHNDWLTRRSPGVSPARTPCCWRWPAPCRCCCSPRMGSLPLLTIGRHPLWNPSCQSEAKKLKILLSATVFILYRPWIVWLSFFSAIPGVVVSCTIFIFIRGLQKLLVCSLEDISPEPPLLPVCPDHPDSRLGPRLLQLAIHPPDQGLVVVYELVDGVWGVSVACTPAR